METLKIYAESS